MANTNVVNKKAYFEFEILDTYTAGIVLTGTEIKSIRLGKIQMSDAFCAFQGTEIVLRNMHINEYEFGSYFNHEPKRQRTLLLHKKEIKKIGAKVKEKGLTIIPLKLFINDRGFAKVEIGIAKGKKLFDKRDSIKEKDSKRDLDRRHSD